MNALKGILLAACGSMLLACGSTRDSSDILQAYDNDPGVDIGSDLVQDEVADVSRDSAVDAAVDVAADESVEADAPPTRTFTILTFNVGTTDNISHDGDPDGYSDALSVVNAAFYGNNLAWLPAQDSLKSLLEALKPDIIGFQELYFDGNCTSDCAAIEAGDPVLFSAACEGDSMACGTWTTGGPITVRRILGPDYAVACAPNHPDNCVAVRKSFGALKDCDDGPCLDGLDGLRPPNGCTGGARVATAVIGLVDGPEVAVVDVHTTAGTNVECRTAQFQQVFEDRGDGKPATFGQHNIVVGDMNIDPFLMNPDYDASVAYWNQKVGVGKPFQYLSSSDSSGPNTHPYSFMKLDHVISNDLIGSCVVLGVSEGTTAPLSIDSTYFDHRPVYCVVNVP